MPKLPPPAQLRISREVALPLEAVTQTFAILAKRGAGKTHTATVLVEEMVAAALPVVIVDPIGVWFGLRSGADGTSKGLPVYILGGEHGDVALDETAGEVIADFIVETRQPVVLDVSLFSKSGARRFMTDFAERLYRVNRAPLHLVLDEADSFVPQRIDRGGERLVGAINDIVRRGRARGLGVTLISQRPAVINKDVLTQVEVLIALRMTGPQDRDAIARWVEHHADPKQAEKVLASLPSLDIGEAWIWSPGWLDLFARTRIRARRTFDSSATPKVGATTAAPRAFADVDLDTLRARIATASEHVEPKDAPELRRRIKALELELTKRVEVAVPAVSEEQLARLEELGATLAEAARRLEPTVAALGELARIVAAAVAATRGSASQRPLGVSSTPSDAAPPPRRAKLPPASTPGELPSLRAGERRMLDTLARHDPVKLTRAQLGTLAKFTPSGGTFATYLGTLRRVGYVVEDAQGLALSPEGLRAAGGVTARPQTTDEILAMWRTALRAGERRLLDVLIGARPRSMTRRELGDIAGFESSGGTFATYLGTLRRNGLVDVVGDSARVSESLFLSEKPLRTKR